MSPSGHNVYPAVNCVTVTRSRGTSSVLRNAVGRRDAPCVLDGAA